LSPRSERVLSSRELNRSLLARQLLLKRLRLPLTTALERVGGLQTQYAPSGYIGLWSRLEGFRREALTTALERRRVIEGTLMRTTIHLVSARDYPLLAVGVRRARREWWLRIHAKEVAGLDMDAVAGRLREHLAGGPLRATDLIERLQADGFPPLAWSGAGLWVDMVRVPPSGTWERRRADLYGLADSWLGASEATEEEGLEHLVRRYLGGFGPAPPNDVAGWAGVPVTALRPALERLELRRFRDEQGGLLLDLPHGALPDPDTPAPVRLLPTYDTPLLAHGRRTAILPEEYRGLVFHTKNPQSIPTFLVDGAVAGSWRYEEGHVLLEPFRSVPRAIRRELQEEAERLAAFHRD
jgi:hypothetical protein